MEWWLKTEYGAKKRIRWESPRRSSTIWDSFDQVAQISDGKAKLMCKKCGGILDHPHNNEHGTSTMARHLKGSQCRNISAGRTKQKGIISLIQDIVSDLVQAIILLLIFNGLYKPPLRPSSHSNLGKRSFLPSLQGLSFPSRSSSIPSFKNYLSSPDLPPHGPIFLPLEQFDGDRRI